LHLTVPYSSAAAERAISRISQLDRNTLQHSIKEPSFFNYLFVRANRSLVDRFVEDVAGTIRAARPAVKPGSGIGSAVRIETGPAPTPSPANTAVATRTDAAGRGGAEVEDEDEVTAKAGEAETVDATVNNGNAPATVPVNPTPRQMHPFFLRTAAKRALPVRPAGQGTVLDGESGTSSGSGTSSSDSEGNSRDSDSDDADDSDFEDADGRGHRPTAKAASTDEDGIEEPRARMQTKKPAKLAKVVPNQNKRSNMKR
jgi:hypothetical protein